MFNKFLFLSVVCGLIGASGVTVLASPNVKMVNKSTQTTSVPFQIVWGLGESAYANRRGDDWKKISPKSKVGGFNVCSSLQVFEKSVEGLGLNNGIKDTICLAARVGIKLCTGQVGEKTKFYENNN